MKKIRNEERFLIWNVLLLYLFISILVFVKNAYRMCHTAFLHNKFVNNINNHQPEKNYELIIPIQKVFHKAHIHFVNVEREAEFHYGVSKSFENSFQKAYYHYKYLMKHCFTWIFRIPFPKFKFIKNEKLNLLVRVLFFIVSTLAVYLFEVLLDNYGFGTRFLNLLSDFLNRLI